jgi:hypothetical protein
MKNWSMMETPKEKAEFVREHLFGIHPDEAGYIADEIKRAFDAVNEVWILQRDRRSLMRYIDSLKEELDDERAEYWL